MAELREQHNLIIVDSPPVAHLADASILAAISDGIVLVARVGVTNRADLPAAAAESPAQPDPDRRDDRAQPADDRRELLPDANRGPPGRDGDGRLRPSCSARWLERHEGVQRNQAL